MGNGWPSRAEAVATRSGRVPRSMSRSRPPTQGADHDHDATTGGRPAGGCRSYRQPDRMGAGGVPCRVFADDRHPDRTRRAGGELTFWIDSGVTVEGTIEIDLRPAVLTSDEDDICVSTGSSCIPGSDTTAAFSPTVDGADGRVRLHVPANLGAGTSVTVSGLLLSVPASGIETLEARISAVENRMVPRSAPVIARVVDAIVIDPSTDAVYAYNAFRAHVDVLGDFTFSEGFAEAFDHPSGGTEIIFQATSLLGNTQLRFPAEIPSETSDAVLRTVSGSEVTLESGGFDDRAVYRFFPGPSSWTVVDAFSLRPVLERTGTPEAGTGFYQVTMGPTGRLNSRVVPRYAEFLLPELADLQPTKTFLFPVAAGVDRPVFTVSNTASGPVPLTLRAFDAAGDLLEEPNAAAERSRQLGGHRSLTFDLEGMFGRSATAATVAAVAIEAESDRPVATAIGTTPGGAFATHSQTPVDSAYFPFDRRNSGEMPLVSVAGDGAANFASLWTLMDTVGTVQAEAAWEVAAGGAVRGSVDTLFGVDANAVPLAGYVHVEAIGTRFRGSLVDNPGAGTHAVPPLLASGQTQVMFPYFVAGGDTTRS